MATTIESIVYSFILDPSGFIAASASIRREITETSRLIEQQTENADESLSRMGKAFNDAKSYVKGLYSTLDEASEGINHLGGAASALFATLLGASSVSELVANVLNANAALGDLSDKTGIATQDLQAWGNIADLTGGKADDMRQGMAKIAEELDAVQRGGEQGDTLKFFKNMGVSITEANGKLRSQKDLMLDMADRLKDMNPMQAAAATKDSGLNESQIAVMMQGRQALEEMLQAQQKNALLSEEQAARAQHLTTAWVELKQSVGALAQQFVNDISPALEVFMGIINHIFDYLKEHRGLMYGFFIGLAAAMAPAIIAAFSMAAGVLAATWPFLALGAAIALVIDWFISWQEGGESAIGSIIDWIGNLISWFADLLAKFSENPFSALLKYMLPVYPAFKLLHWLFGKAKEGWNDFKGSDFSVDGLFHFLKKAAVGIKALISDTKLLGELLSAVMSGNWQDVKAVYRKMIDVASDAMLEDDKKENLQTGTAAQGIAAPKGASANTVTPQKAVSKVPASQDRKLPSATKGSSSSEQKRSGRANKSAQPTNIAYSPSGNDGIYSLISTGMISVKDSMSVGESPNLTAVTHRKSLFDFSGARAQTRLMNNPNQSNTSTQHVETNIGNITVMTQAKDSKGIAADIGHDLKNRFNAGIYNLNSGLA